MLLNTIFSACSEEHLNSEWTGQHIVLLICGNNNKTINIYERDEFPFFWYSLNYDSNTSCPKYIQVWIVSLKICLPVVWKLWFRAKIMWSLSFSLCMWTILNLRFAYWPIQHIYLQYMHIIFTIFIYTWIYMTIPHCSYSATDLHVYSKDSFIYRTIAASF